MSPFENVFFQSAVLTRSFIGYFAFILLRLSNKFLYTNPSFFFKLACIGVNLVDECILLFYCFVIIGNTSIQLASLRSKTIFLRRSLIGRLNISAKTAPYELFLE